MKKLLLLIICLLTLTGCGNYNELSNLSIVSSMHIKYKDNYHVTLEIYDNKKVKVIDGVGNTLTDALDDANRKTSKNLYYQHLNAVFISDDQCIHDVIDYFLRNPNINNAFYLLYTEEDDIYKDNINIGKLVKDDIKGNYNYSFFNIITSYINNTKDIYLPIYKDNEVNGIITIHDNKFVSIYTQDDVSIINTLLSDSNNNLYVPCDNNYFVLNLENIKVKYNIKDNIVIDVIGYGNIEEYTCELDTTKVNNIKILEDLASNELNKRVLNIINKLKEDNTDILGINTKLNNKYRTLNNNFTNYNYKVNSNIHLYKKGLLLK